MSAEGGTVRPATPSDCSEILKMIKELAAFHRNPNKVHIDENVLIADGFGEKAHFSCAVAEVKEAEEFKPVGFVLYYETYSTWVGKTMYVEDIYVREAYRKRGLGRGLLKHVTQDALGRGAMRVGWSALVWNENAIDFYKKQGAEMSDDWRTFTLSKGAMEALVQTSNS